MVLIKKELSIHNKINIKSFLENFNINGIVKFKIKQILFLCREVGGYNYHKYFYSQIDKKRKVNKYYK